MHITQLRLQGFKSFVEATDLLIRPGLTGVVGPNGCGKSNLLEALRWVMGETSYKAMRGGAMDDVIFAGTQSRPPRNSAAVSVFVDNSARTAPAEFNDEDELEITRLIQRGEGSSYRVNGRDVRAKDVKLLFEDAATGARSHALVRQGQIGEIVNSKPEARRRILEDAAGIAGLHSRRHEAELRLNAAEANLERLADVMGQLDAQLTSLKRQARHAQRYKEISHKLRGLEALVYYLKWQGCVNAVSLAEADLGKVLETVQAETLAETKALNEREVLSQAIKPLREAEATAAAALHRLELAAGELDRQAAQQKARQEELATALDDAKSDLARDRHLIEEGTQTTARLDGEIAALEAETAKLGSLGDEARGKVERAAGDLAAAEGELSQISQQVAEAGARRTALGVDLKRQQERAKHFTALTQQLEDERDALGGDLESGNAAETADDIARCAEEIAALEASLETDNEALEQARLEVERLSAMQTNASLDSRALQTEIAMIEKLLTPQNTGGRASIMDAVEITRGYEQALWAAVGDELEMPVVDGSNDVNDGDLTGYWRHLDVARCPLPAGVRPLSDFVKAPAALMARLDHTGVVADEDAARLHAMLAPGQRLVSRSGGLWRWDGFCLAASGAAAPALRLTERNRLPELLQARDAAEAALAGSGEAIRQAREAANALAAQVKEARQTLAALKQQHSEFQQAQQQEAAKAQAAERRLAAIEEGLANAARETNQAAEIAIELNLAVAALPAANMQEAALSSQRDVTADLRQAHSTAQMEWAALSGREEMNRKRIEEMQGEQQRWRARVSEAEQHVAQLTSRIEKTQQELAQFADLPDKLASQRQALFAEKAAAEATHSDAGDALAEAESAALAHEKTLRRLQAQLMEVREDKARVETRLEGARAGLMQIANEIESELKVKPDGCLELAGMGPEAILPKLSEAEAEVARLKRDRDRLGAVNLRADEEIRSLEEQFGGMASERDDLTEAVAQLRRAVSQLNEEGRQRLLKAFDVVNGHFKRLFQTLFAGGEASLTLVDSDDPLEAGLEIIARPPGKKPQVLTLLSGGEKALTAMSLIFAVFLTNPSPICVLDEVDAPLDDTNVDRFCVMMEEMARSTDTRFLVITHHPMTMERMDRLFGVTMSEKGVSQLVSVDLATAEGMRESA